jgi:ParB/Sulfiredoxin domain
VVEVAVDSLRVAGSPRVSGENPEHVQALAAAQTPLPPIIVHQATMRVIDGVHRLRAARLRGEDKIAAYFFCGDEADAFVLAVRSNVTHGLPLMLADRKAAAARIIGTHSQWSDRMIAAVTGLAAGTVAEIRKRGEGSPIEKARIGQDGRVRPINGSQGRMLASEIMTENPGLSLRQVAQEAGISPETARDVRNRLRRGEDPVPKRQSRDRSRQPRAAPAKRPEAARSIERGRPSAESRTAAIQRLRADPALRFSETGRTLLRLLHIYMLKSEEWERISDNVPPHCSGIVVHLARECAQIWQDFADRVERKVADIA